jgi:hypothetical protein
MNLTTLLITLVIGQSAVAQTFCPPGPGEVDPVVKAKVSFDRKKKIYTYSYEVKNGITAKIPLNSFELRSDYDVRNIKVPSKWLGEDVKFDEVGYIQFAAALNYVLPGKSLSGFSFTSDIAPGFVPSNFDGKTQSPVVQASKGDDEPVPQCDGFFYDRPAIESNPIGFTIGPALKDTVTAKLKYINKSHRHFDHKNRAPLDPTSKGQVKLELRSQSDLDVEQIDLASLKFGFGKAKPVATKIITKKGDDKDSDEVEKSNDSANSKDGDSKHDDGEVRAEGDDGPRSKAPKSKLVLTFNLEDIGIRCQLDHALMLNGSIGPADNKKKLIAFAPMLPKACTKALRDEMRSFDKKKGIKHFEHEGEQGE